MPLPLCRSSCQLSDWCITRMVIQQHPVRWCSPVARGPACCEAIEIETINPRKLHYKREIKTCLSGSSVVHFLRRVRAQFLQNRFPPMDLRRQRSATTGACTCEAVRRQSGPMGHGAAPLGVPHDRAPHCVDPVLLKKLQVATRMLTR